MTEALPEEENFPLATLIRNDYPEKVNDIRRVAHPIKQ